jgi:hypothetical protein
LLHLPKLYIESNGVYLCFEIGNRIHAILVLHDSRDSGAAYLHGVHGYDPKLGFVNRVEMPSLEFRAKILF